MTVERFDMKNEPKISHFSEPEMRSLMVLLRSNSARLSAKDNHDFQVAIRDEYLVLTALNTGLKTSELTQLKLKHFNLKSKVLDIRSFKNRRKIPLSTRFRKEITGYIERKQLSAENYMFPSDGKQQMTERAIQLRFQIYMKKLNMKHSIGDLRHTYGIRMLQIIRDPYWVAQLLGLKTLSHIFTYLLEIKTTPKEKWEAIEKLRWPF